MAIKFLDAIDLTGLEIQNVLLQNSAGTPSSNLGGGQIVYDSQAGTIKYYDDVNTQWVELDGQGGVTGITAGDGITVSSGTGNVTVSVDYTGTDNAILKAKNGTGSTLNGPDLIWYSSNSSNEIIYAEVGDLPFSNNAGTVTSVGTSNSTFISGSGGPITGSGNLSYSLSATGTPSSTTYLRGDNSWATIPAGFAGFSFSDGKGSFSVATGDTISLTSSTLTWDANTATTIDIEMPSVNSNVGSFTSANITVDAQGRVTAASTGGAGTMSSFDVNSDGGTKQTISNGETLVISGGTALTGVVSNVDTVTINHDSYGTAGTYSYPSQVVTNAQGHVTSITSGSAPGTMSSFKLSGDSGTQQSISNGDVLSILGSTGIDTAASNTDTITVSLDLCELGESKTFAASDYLVGCVGSSNAKVLVSNIDLNEFAAPTSSLDLGSQKITGMADPTSAQDASTKNYVDTSIAGSGSLIYQGGYNANTNQPNLTSTGQGILKGFTYAVTTAGDASGFWSPTLEIGDLVIANSDNPASAADWTEINKNIDVATTTVKGIASFPTAGGLTVSSGEVSMAAVGSSGSVGSSSQSLSITTDAKGRVTSRSAQNISIGASQVSNFCTEVVSCQTAREKVGTIGNATSWSIAHNFGTKNVMVQVYSNTSPYDNVEVKITRPNTKEVTITVANNPGTSALNYMIQKIG